MRKLQEGIYLTVKAYAEIKGISRQAVFKRIKNKKLVVISVPCNGGWGYLIDVKASLVNFELNNLLEEYKKRILKTLSQDSERVNK